MHILKGKISGFNIPIIKGSKARPTTQKVKEIIFELLEQEDLINPQTNVLDLFAGTGSMSLEFASRDAHTVVAVELDKLNINALGKIKKAHSLDNLILKKQNVFTFLEKNKQEFDIVFADPPYRMQGIQNLPNQLKATNTIKDNSIFILEHEKNILFNKNIENNTRIYGNTAFSIFRF